MRQKRVFSVLERLWYDKPKRAEHNLDICRRYAGIGREENGMERVLVVEDEGRIRDIIQDYFSVHGMECDLARDGEEALDLLQDHDYDAILLDVLMPRLDGFGVCRAVRKNSRVPILFLTALGGEEEVLQGYALGCDDCD